MNRLPYSLQCYLDEISENYAHLTDEQIIDIIKSDDNQYSMPLFYLLFGRHFGLFCDAFNHFQINENYSSMLFTDIYMKLHSNNANAIKKFDVSKAKFSTYLYTIIQNHTTDFLRNASKDPLCNTEPLSDAINEIANPDTRYKLTELLEIIDRNCKNPRYKYILTFLLYGYSTDEILERANSDENAPFNGHLTKDNLYQIKKRAIEFIRESCQENHEMDIPTISGPFMSFMPTGTPAKEARFADTDTLFDKPISVGQTNNIFIKNLIELYNKIVRS